MNEEVLDQCFHLILRSLVYGHTSEFTGMSINKLSELLSEHYPNEYNEMLYEMANELKEIQNKKQFARLADKVKNHE